MNRHPNERDVGNNQLDLGDLGKLLGVQQGQNLSNSFWWPKIILGIYSITLKGNQPRPQPVL